MRRHFWKLGSLAVAAAGGYLLGYSHNSDRVGRAHLARGEALARSLTGVVLEGSYTLEGGAPQPERYVIERVEQAGGDNWVFHTKIQFAEVAPLDRVIPARIEWAGDTAVISLSALEVSGLGTFDARIALYRDGYAGFWSNGGSGGRQFGTLTPAPE